MKKKAKISSLLLSLFLIIAVSLAGCGGSNQETSGSSSGNSGGDSSSGGSSSASSGESESEGEAKEPRVLRISNGINDKHPAYKASLKFKEIVEGQTDDLVIEVYHSGQIGDDRTATEMLQLGTLAMVVTSTSPLVNWIPEYGVFDLPFTIPNEQVADKVLDGPFGQKMLEMVESQGLVGLAWWENGFRNLTNSARAVDSVEDLEGLKIRVMQNQIHLDAWKALGANPTPMAFTELFTAMQQGTVDGQENPYPTIDLSKFYEVQDHVSNTNHVYTPFVMLFSQKIWNELTPEQQTVLKDAAVEAGKYNRKLNRETAQSSLDKLKGLMTYTEISPEERARFQEKVMPVINEHAKDIGEDIVQEFLDEVEKAQQ